MTTIAEGLSRVASLNAEQIEHVAQRNGLEDSDRLETFELQTRRAFKRGVHTAHQKAATSFLREQCGNQQAAAEELALRGHSSISKIEAAGTIDGQNLTWILFRFPGQVALPTFDEALVCGYIEAVSHVRETEIGDESFQRKIGQREFEVLVEILSDAGWCAVRPGDTTVRQRLSEDLVSRVVREFPETPITTTFLLEQLLHEWRLPLFLALFVLQGETTRSARDDLRDVVAALSDMERQLIRLDELDLGQKEELLRVAKLTAEDALVVRRWLEFKVSHEMRRRGHTSW